MTNEINIGEIIVEDEIDIGDIEFDVLKEVPEYESLIIFPTVEEQIKEGIFNKVTVVGDENLISQNIVEGVKIFNVEGIAKKNSGKYVWSKYKDYIEGEIEPTNTKLLLHLDNNVLDTTGFNTPTIYGSELYDTGRFGNAYKFDGSNTIKLPYNSNIALGANDFTIAGWFYTETVKNQGFFSHNYYHSYSYKSAGIKVSMNANGNFYVQVFLKHVTENAIAIPIDKTLDVAVPTGKWFHLALVRKSNTVTLYLNGTSIASGTITVDNNYVIYQNSNSSFKLGSITNSNNSDTPTNFFDGLIDEFIIVNGTALWTSNFTPPTFAYGGNPGILEEYVVSNNEKSYPNNDYDENGYYYISGIK